MVEQFSSFWSRSAHPSPIVPFYGSPPAVLGRPPIKLFHHDLHQIFNARQFQQQPNAFSQSPRPHSAAEAHHVYNDLQFQQQPNGFSPSSMPRPAAEAPGPQKSALHMLLDGNLVKVASAHVDTSATAKAVDAGIGSDVLVRTICSRVNG